MKKNVTIFSLLCFAVFSLFGLTGCEKNLGQFETLFVGLQIAHLQALDSGAYSAEDADVVSKQIREVINKDGISLVDIAQFAIANLGNKQAAGLTIIINGYISQGMLFENPINETQRKQLNVGMDTIDAITAIYR